MLFGSSTGDFGALLASSCSRSSSTLVPRQALVLWLPLVQRMRMHLDDDSWACTTATKRCTSASASAMQDAAQCLLVPADRGSLLRAQVSTGWDSSPCARRTGRRRAEGRGRESRVEDMDRRTDGQSTDRQTARLVTFNFASPARRTITTHGAVRCAGQAAAATPRPRHSDAPTQHMVNVGWLAKSGSRRKLQHLEQNPGVQAAGACRGARATGGRRW